MCRRLLVVALFATLILTVGLLAPAAVFAQSHGVTIQKVCTAEPRTCAENADCSDNNACNGLETCDLSIPHTTVCHITITNADGFNDSITVKNAFDVIKPFLADQTIIPDLTIESVSGNTTCVVGGQPLLATPGTWCVIGPNTGSGAGSVTFISNSYVPLPTDPDPLPDQGTVVVADNCDAPGTLNCNTSNAQVSFSAESNLVSGCVPGPPLNCDDSNACTTDSCDPINGCANAPIVCNDNNACTTDTCDPATGCVATPIVCNDNNACTTDSCDPINGCVATPIVCNDNNACTTDTCDPATGCVATPIVCNDNNACTTDTCDPINGCVATPIVCNDNNACTTDSCDPVDGCRATPIVCNDNNACTTDTCDPINGCQTTPIVCNDNNACTTDTCDPINGCQTTPIVCNDNNACTTDTCNPATGCVATPIVCNDNNACTTDTCDPVNGCVATPIVCNDNNACTTDTCDPVNGCVATPIVCNDNNACTTDTCNPATGCVATPISCDDNNVCTTDTCNPATGCVNTENDLCETPTGCRITAGGITPNGNVDEKKFADITKGTFGGQVGAPCGCVGPGGFEGFESIQGNWTFMRKGPGLGSFHASGFNSLVCGCDPSPQDSDGVRGNLQGLLTGQLCNPRDRDKGPFPPNAPANLACFTGIGGFNETSGPRDTTVAFRVEVEDRSQPGGGKNSGPSPSVFRIRIWIPTTGETAEDLAHQVACNGPLGTDFCPQDPAVRAPDIDDGSGGLIHGAIQIHKQIAAHEGSCPVHEACPTPACQDSE